MPTRERFLLRQAYGGTSRPDKCLVVKSLDSSLRTVCPSQHGIHRHHHQGVEGTKRKAAMGVSVLFSAGAEAEKPDGGFTRSKPPQGRQCGGKPAHGCGFLLERHSGRPL
jgi:hypothetical protein